MDCLESVEKNFIVNAEFDGEPVKLVKDRGDVTDGGGFCDDAGSSVLDQL